MKVTKEIENIKSLKGFLKVIKSFGENVHILTLKYNRHYQIVLGSSSDNVFIMLNIEDPYKPILTITERKLSMGDKAIFILGRDFQLQISKIGREDITLAFYQYANSGEL